MTTERVKCPYGFNGTEEQLICALRYHAKRESRSTFFVKETAAWLLEQKNVENDKLRARIEELRSILSDQIGTMVDV